MRKHLKRILTIFILCWMAMHVVAQVNLGPDRDKIFKVSAKSTSNSRVKGDPMVIGPTLYYQMGTLGDYFALSTEYTNEQLAEFTGMTADDFIIPSGESWEIGYVRFTFYAPFALSEIDNYHVIFYNDNYGKPGAIAKELTNQTDVRIEYRNENAYMFDLTVNLSETVTLTNAGKYWFVCCLLLQLQHYRVIINQISGQVKCFSQLVQASTAKPTRKIPWRIFLHYIMG
jgi:hypothetical protein